MRRALALALAAVAACSLSLGCCTRVSVVGGGSGATAVDEIVVEPGAATGLSVETVAGDVRVGPAAAARGPVTVRATKSARTAADLSRVRPFARVEGDTLRVGYEVDPGVDGVGVSFALEAPPMERTRLRTSAGDIVLLGADGTVDAESSAGSVTVSGRLRGACRLRTSAGNVEASVPADSRLKVLGHTNAGNAVSEHPVGAGKAFASANIVGTLGDGTGGTLEMDTSAGNLALRRLP